MTTRVVPAEGIILEHILEQTHQARPEPGLSRDGYRRFEAAQIKAGSGTRHRQRFALVEDGAEVLASATRYCFAGAIDQRAIRIWAIGGVLVNPLHGADDRAQALIDWLLDEAARDGADLALLVSDVDSPERESHGFEPIPNTEVTLAVAQSPRHGAPMTLIRRGETRDVQAIVAMGRVRASPFRFHLDRDADLVEHAITKKRLLAGLAPAGTRQLHFFIAEEGITAAAYVVVSVVGTTWTIEECGDRDPSGARVGALLQGLLALEPAERVPTIRGWLPPGFLPPQVAILSAKPSVEHIGVRPIGAVTKRLGLSGDDVLCWHGDFSRPY